MTGLMQCFSTVNEPDAGGAARKAAPAKVGNVSWSALAEPLTYLHIEQMKLMKRTPDVHGY